MLNKATAKTIIKSAEYNENMEAVEDGWIPAGETWTYASADAPTYIFTITGDKTSNYSAGMKIKLTQPTDGVKYGIITKVAYSAPNTTITIYMGTDYDLDNEAITSPYYSLVKAPHGFPLDPDKWTVEVTDANNRTQANAANGTWYNIDASHKINVPIGIWEVGYIAYPLVEEQSLRYVSVMLTLSKANNTQDDNEFSTIAQNRAEIGANFLRAGGSLTTRKNLNLSTKDTYYLNAMSSWIGGDDDIIINGSVITTRIWAICAYL